MISRQAAKPAKIDLPLRKRTTMPCELPRRGHFFAAQSAKKRRNLLKKTKKELSILCGNPQGLEQIAHANPEMFVIVIHRGGMVRFGLWLGLLAGGK
jgi:hypothetical protein